MAKKSKISLILFLTIVVLVVGATAMKVITSHNEKLLLVLTNEIEYNARRCFLDEVCTGEEITLHELIEKDYSEKEIHPITKEYVNENLIITCKDYVCKCKLN